MERTYGIQGGVKGFTAGIEPVRAESGKVN